ncbi:MAG: PAS domain-containing protein [Cyanobacteria bacterium P01_D01_bin.115]
MGITQQIEAVYERALSLRDKATRSPVSPELLESALNDLYFVLEELHTADEEIRQQNIELSATRLTIEEERQRYRTLFELAPDAYLVTDHQGLIHRVNRAATNLFSTSREVLIGKPLVVLIDAADRPQVLTQLTHPNHQQDWQVTLADPAATPIVVSVSTAWLTSTRHQHTRAAVLWLLRNITQREQTTQQLRAAHDQSEQQLTTCTVELAHVKAQLQQEVIARRQAEQAQTE